MYVSRTKDRVAKAVTGAFLAVGVAVVSGLAAAPGDAPVADAARIGDLHTVRALLQEGADVNAAHGDGMSALHWAAERGDGELVAAFFFFLE